MPKTSSTAAQMCLGATASLLNDKGESNARGPIPHGVRQGDHPYHQRGHCTSSRMRRHIVSVRERFSADANGASSMLTRQCSLASFLFA
jgi:hypothetical protein